GVGSPGACHKVCVAEITSMGGELDPQFVPARGAGEFDVDLIAVDRILKQLYGLFRPQSRLNRMVTLTEAIDEALLLRSVWIGRWRRRRRIPGHLLHLLPKAQRPHIGPDLLDQGQAVGLWTNFADIPPPEGVLLVFRPDRILLFVINYDFIYCGVFSIGVVPAHFSDLLLCQF